MTWELTSGRFEDCVVNSVCDMFSSGCRLMSAPLLEV